MNAHLKSQAKELTQNLCPRLFLPMFIVFLITAILESIYLGFLISFVFDYMISIFTLNFVNTKEREIGDMFKDYFKTDNLIEIIKANFIMVLINSIFIILDIVGAILTTVLNPLYVLMTIFASIPTLIVGYFFFAVPYLIKDSDYKINVKECFKLSNKMMNGHKWELFLLKLSFIPQMLLCIITIGIYSIWFIPYYNVTLALYYKQIKEEYLNNNSGDLEDMIKNPDDVNVEDSEENIIFDNPEDVLRKNDSVFIELSEDDIISPDDDIDSIFEEIKEDKNK